MTAESNEVAQNPELPQYGPKVETLAQHLDLELVELQQQILEERVGLVEKIQSNRAALEALGLSEDADEARIRGALQELHEYLQERAEVVEQKKKFMDRWYAAPLRWARNTVNFAYDQVVHHPYRTAIIVGGVALGWYFRHFLIAYLHELSSGAPQVALEDGMGADGAIRGPDPVVDPVPDTPTPAETENLIPNDPPLSSGDLPEPPPDVPPSEPPPPFVPPRGFR